jgi:acetylornithine aminotransferase
VLGDFIAARFGQLGNKVTLVRGAGLLQGVVLSKPVAKEVETRALADGVLCNAAAPDVIRIAPPLVIADGELSAACDVIAAAIDRAVK